MSRWQPTQDGLASLNSSVGWQLRQAAVWCPPVSGKPVSLRWSNSFETAAGTQRSGAWQSAQSSVNSPWG